MMFILNFDKENLFKSEYQSELFWTIQCWSVLALWLRFLIYMRTKDKYDLVIRLIIDSFIDMIRSIVVIFIGMLGFASAFLAIGEVLKFKGKKEFEIVAEDAIWYEKYAGDWVEAFKVSLLTVFGQFTEDLPLYRPLDWVIFILCIIVNLIIIFNILIAIVSDTFTRFKENWE